MSYHGFEIFFLTLGNADSIFIEYHDQGTKTNVLIDGGRKKHAEGVRRFLSDRGESEIHHLVCSHNHDDHAGGLIELVQDETLTIHQAWMHTEEIITKTNLLRYQSLGYNQLVRTLNASIQTQMELLKALQNRGIALKAPWAGQSIGPLVVVSPGQQFYQEQMSKIAEDSVASSLNMRYLLRDTMVFSEMFSATQVTRGTEKEEEEGELGGEPTSPENEVSTVLWLPWQDGDGTRQDCLLTADAGTEALGCVRAMSEERDDELKDILKKLPWMQLPHHGSRRNLNEGLLDYFRPKTSFVSAEGSVKHPSQKLVNAVKAREGRVYSTHYPKKKEGSGSWLRHKNGSVPEVATTPATPLWDAKD